MWSESNPLPPQIPDFTRTEFEDTCKRRFFYGLGFDPYGGVAGLYDFGPVGCQIKNNLINMWRQHFIMEENMLEIETTVMTPEDVFKTSGHVAKFTDVMVTDAVTGDFLRVDKYIEEWVEKKLADPKANLSDTQKDELKLLGIKADGMSIPEFEHEIKKWDIKSVKGNALTAPRDVNLMFPTKIGPGGDKVGYLRPELAQGIMLNFKRMLEYNGGRMPFAGAAIGTAFRNEIAPRNNLIRVREFTLAEIEHFLDPLDKTHPKFASVAATTLWLRPKDRQEAGEEDAVLMSIGDAVKNSVVNNETLGYFMTRVQDFLLSVGVKYLRFRQHRKDEMAHYAADCWDCECLTSFGWVECVGIADRSCYDLTCHGKERKVDFFAYEKYPSPKIERGLDRKIVKGIVNKQFHRESQGVMAFLEGIEEDEALKMEQELADKGSVEITYGEDKKATITRNMVSFAMADKKVSGRSYVPSVIEPSFGLGRIIYAMLEQSYWVRRDKDADDKKNEKRAVFSLPARIAPYKCTVLPLSPSVLREPWCTDIIAKWRSAFAAMGISYKVDDSSQGIGKKYARSDEIGVSYNLTIDPDTKASQKVTLRERDSTKQGD
eukprot:gene9029-13977_t